MQGATGRISSRNRTAEETNTEISMSTRRIALAVFVVAVGIIAVGSAHAQDKPVIAVSNNYQAYAAAIDSINDGKARQCSSKTRRTIRPLLILNLKKS
jgi:hypothetical protein